MERYKSRGEFVAKITAAANALAEQRYILKADVQAVVDQAGRHYDWGNQVEQAPISSMRPGAGRG